MNRIFCAIRNAALFLGLALGASQGVWAQASGNSIESFHVTRQDEAIVLKLTLKNAPKSAPSSFSIANPSRLAFDFPETSNGLGRNAQPINVGELHSANIVEVGGRTRLVLNLDKMVTYDTRVDGRVVNISLRSVGTAVSTAADAPPVQHFAATETSEGQHSIREVAFRRGKDGEGRVVVDLSDPHVGVDIRRQGTNLIVDFQKTKLPENLMRRLDVTDFATPVTAVSSTATGDTARITISPRGNWEHNAYQADNQFVVEVKQIVEDPKKLVQGSRGGFQGEKVSLNFQNIPLRELLHVFADITNFNIVASDTVGGNISLRLNEVPWDQALEIVLQQKSLAMRKNGNVLWIAPRDELAAKEKLELEAIQQIGDLEPTRTEGIQLNFQKAEALQKLLTDKNQPMLSKRGSVVIDARTNKVFVKDTPSRIEEVRRLIAEIDVPVRQVLIEARIVEADNSFSKSLGVRLGGTDGKGHTQGHQLGGSEDVRFGIAGSAPDANRILPFNSSILGGRINNITENGVTFDKLSPNTSVDFRNSQFVNLGAANPAGQFALSLFNASKTQLLTLELSALEADGKGKTISSPRILTADQVEAMIEDGTEVPYWSASASGATSVSYRKATLSLKVRPQITPDGSVILTLEVNKDAVNTRVSTSYGVAIDTKHVKTEVLVENGGTVVIGGIYIQEEKNNVTRVPFLGDLPYVGFLFRQTEKSDNRKELLVFITPKVVSDKLSLR